MTSPTDEVSHGHDDDPECPRLPSDLPALFNWFIGRNEQGKSHPPERVAPFEAPFARPIEHWRFWLDFLVVVLMGGLLGLFGVGYVEVTRLVPEAWTQADGNGDYPSSKASLEWAAGRVWWIGIGALAGVFTGAIKAATNMDQYPSLITEIRGGHCDWWVSLRVTGLCLIAEMGGASLGPEAGMGAMGSFVGWLAGLALARLGVRHVDSRFYVIAGICAALGPFMPSPFLAVVMVIEAGLPLTHPAWRGRSPMATLILFAATSGVSFGVYFALLPEPVLSLESTAWLALNTRDIKDYDWLVGILFGFLGSLLALAFVLIGGVVGKLAQLVTAAVDRLGARRLRMFALPVLGGTAFGALMYVFPMTVGSGDMVLDEFDGISWDVGDSGLLVASAFVKMLAYWLASHAGFVGGCFLPMLLVGTIWGQLFHVWSGVNAVLAQSCAFVSLLAAFVPLPGFLVLLAFMTMTLGKEALWPLLFTVATAYLFFVGIGVPQAILALAKTPEDDDQVKQAEQAH